MKTQEEIEQLANQWSDDYEKGANRDIAKRSYIAGYTQYQQDSKHFLSKETLDELFNLHDEDDFIDEDSDKKYTEEDMRQSFMAGVDCENGNGKNFNQFIISLNKQ